MWALSNYCYYWSYIHNKKALAVITSYKFCVVVVVACALVYVLVRMCCVCVTMLFVCVLDVLYAIHTNTVERQRWVRCIAVDGFLSSFRIGPSVCVCVCLIVCMCRVTAEFQYGVKCQISTHKSARWLETLVLSTTEHQCVVQCWKSFEIHTQ